MDNYDESCRNISNNLRHIIDYGQPIPRELASICFEIADRENLVYNCKGREDVIFTKSELTRARYEHHRRNNSVCGVDFDSLPPLECKSRTFKKDPLCKNFWLPNKHTSIGQICRTQDSVDKNSNLWKIYNPQNNTDIACGLFYKGKLKIIIYIPNDAMEARRSIWEEIESKGRIVRFNLEHNCSGGNDAVDIKWSMVARDSKVQKIDLIS